MFTARLPCGFRVTLDERTVTEWRGAETVCLFDALQLSGCPVEEAIEAASAGLVRVDDVEIESSAAVTS